MPATRTARTFKAAAFKLAHLTAKAPEGRRLAEDLLEIGKRTALNRSLHCCLTNRL